MKTFKKFGPKKINLCRLITEYGHLREYTYVHIETLGEEKLLKNEPHFQNVFGSKNYSCPLAKFRPHHMLWKYILDHLVPIKMSISNNRFALLHR